MAAGWVLPFSTDYQVTHQTIVCSFCGLAKRGEEFTGFVIVDDGARIEQRLFIRNYCTLCSLQTSWDLVAGPDWI